MVNGVTRRGGELTLQEILQYDHNVNEPVDAAAPAPTSAAADSSLLSEMELVLVAVGSVFGVALLVGIAYLTFKRMNAARTATNADTKIQPASDDTSSDAEAQGKIAQIVSVRPSDHCNRLPPLASKSTPSA